MPIPCLLFYQMIPEKLQEVLILDFEPNFRDNLEQVLEEAHRLRSTVVGPHVSFGMDNEQVRPSQLNCLFGVDRPTQILHDRRKFFKFKLD